MLIIDNDYMINNRGIDMQSRLKINDNQSGAVQIFFEQLSFRLYDYILNVSTKFTGYDSIDTFINQLSELNQKQYKRALSEQALYFVSRGDINYMKYDGSINYAIWNNMRTCTQTKDIVRNLGMIDKSALVYDGLYRVPQNFDNEYMG